MFWFPIQFFKRLVTTGPCCWRTFMSPWSGVVSIFVISTHLHLVIQLVVLGCCDCSNSWVTNRAFVKMRKTCGHSLILTKLFPSHSLSFCLYQLLCFSSWLGPSPSKATQMKLCRIIPQPLRHAAPVRRIVCSEFDLTTDVKAAKL